MPESIDGFLFCTYVPLLKSAAECTALRGAVFQKTSLIPNWISRDGTAEVKI